MGRGPTAVAAGVLTSLLVAAGALAIVRGGADRLDPLPPEALADVLPTEAPPSTLAVPLALPLSALVDLLERAVPRTHGTSDSLRQLPTRGRATVSIALERGPFGAAFVDDVVLLATTLRYQLRMSYDLPVLPDPGGTCGLDSARRPGLAVTLRSPVSIGADWTLRTRAEILDVRPLTQDAVDRCEVTLLGLDVTDNVVEGARAFVEEHLDEIDLRASQLDTRSQFQAWWRVLQEPIQIGDSLWLSMDPSAIRRGPVRGTDDSLRVNLALSARPRILLGPRPVLPEVPLPPLDSGGVEPSLDLVVDGRAEYASGSRFLEERLVGRELEVAGRVLRLESLSLYGVGAGRLALEVGVSGDLSGTLYLTGTPFVDAAASRVLVPDLDFDVATERAVFGIVPVFAALGLRDFLRGEASWPLDPAVRFLAEWLQRGLNRHLSADLSVSGTVDSVGIAGVYPLRDALVVRMVALGSAHLVVE